MKILSVDDSAIVRKIIRSGIEVLSYELLEASNGTEALHVLENNYKSIGLILLDCNMPGMNGIELLKTIKSNSNYRKIPVMMVTVNSDKENMIKAIQLGASHYMIKPFTVEELIKRVLECLGKGL